MKNLIALLLLIGVYSCQTAKIKNDTYKISSTNVELASIGKAKHAIDLKNDFEYKAFAKLENRIRLSIEIIPYNKKLNKVYQDKKKFNQNLIPLDYNDTVAKKPELAVIRLMDVAGYVSELNANYNQDVFSLIRETKEIKVVSSIAVPLNSEDLNKIQQADAYYLINNQEKRYTIQLFKQGKKTEIIDVNLSTVVAYKLSSFCWATNTRGVWYIADLAKGISSCKGNTSTQIKEKEVVKNLYKM
ncbi:MAG: hypothetical protein H7339_17060 [Arcicella sp.]|nr:hypothetical protein [Arcicella sp.]